MGRKATNITLSSEDRAYLELQTRTRTIQAQTVNRARILLLKADGTRIDDIADKVGMNRKSVMLCINKYLEGGIEGAQVVGTDGTVYVEGEGYTVTVNAFADTVDASAAGQVPAWEDYAVESPF